MKKEKKISMLRVPRGSVGITSIVRQLQAIGAEQEIKDLELIMHNIDVEAIEKKRKAIRDVVSKYPGYFHIS